MSNIFAVDRNTPATWQSTCAESPVADYPELYRAESEDLIRLWRPEVWTRTVGIA